MSPHWRRDATVGERIARLMHKIARSRIKAWRSSPSGLEPDSAHTSELRTIERCRVTTMTDPTGKERTRNASLAWTIRAGPMRCAAFALETTPDGHTTRVRERVFELTSPTERRKALWADAHTTAREPEDARHTTLIIGRPHVARSTIRALAETLALQRTTEHAKKTRRSQE